jgi:hypothetical protein
VPWVHGSALSLNNAALFQRFRGWNPLTTRPVSLVSKPQEPGMTDDKTNRARPDRDLIDVNDDDELRNWSKSLNKTCDEIKAAVRVVGNSASKVREYLSS